MLLEVRGLGKRFASRADDGTERWAIRDLTFAVHEGELLTIVGPSGSGKSTLLNLVAQIDRPTEGEICILDERIAGGRVRDPANTRLRPGLDGRVGYVTQEDTLLPWRTLIDNVLFPLRVQGRLTAATRERARELVRAVGLEEFQRHYPHELSGGMRKRAALIRTLAYDPPVILMDEPFGALDAQTRAQLQADLLRLCNERRKTIVFVTHDIAEAIALGDRSLVFSRPPARVRAEYAVDLPRPRDVRGIYAIAGFAALYARIRDDLE